MCGIFGIIKPKQSQLSLDDMQDIVSKLFRLSESRGKEASGLAIRYDNLLNVLKRPIPGSKLIRKNEYRHLFSNLRHYLLANRKETAVSIIGHSRLATNGLESDNDNNQPVYSTNALGVHNGIVVNVDYLWKNYSFLKRKYEVDTEIIFALISEFYKKEKSLPKSIQKTFRTIKGAASIASFLTTSNLFVLATNTGSLYIHENKKINILVFASESYIMKTLIEKSVLKKTSKENDYYRLEPQNSLIVNIQDLNTHTFSLKGKVKAIRDTERLKKTVEVVEIRQKKKEKRCTFPSLLISDNLNKIKKLRRHNPPYKAIYKLRRCSKCILPETMPLITFDHHGICNYCNNYGPVKVKGKAALEELVKPYRSKDESPDCIVAFSGGRDSSYGLHYVKKVLRMNPIAYTYDWGMVTDLARRNQSRITGELGIEHIIVSANIKRKRDNIRRNVEAWLKRPDVAIVPLFMAGDKQAEYYAEELKRKTNIKLVIYCRGNKLENEEFKWGYCGIKEGSPEGVLHNLSLIGKIQLAWYYGKQYLFNPSYINRSIFDTLFAYFVAYIMPLDFVYLWHYIEWDENEIISTLTKKYGWEIAKDTKATWRIDDGSVPFYNYIFYALTGFTENDTFRSNQIREGIISREEALKMVHEENKPRCQGLKWYFDQIGIDGDRALTKIDKTPKLYKVD